MSQPPETIYLQWYCGQHDEEWGNPEPGDVTWSPDTVFEDDVEYTRSPRVRYGRTDGTWSYAPYGDIDRIEVDGQVWRVVTKGMQEEASAILAELGR